MEGAGLGEEGPSAEGLRQMSLPTPFTPATGCSQRPASGVFHGPLCVCFFLVPLSCHLALLP